MMNIIFMGTPDFSVVSLKSLIAKYNVEMVITQPDKKKGRGKKLSMSPVKEIALENNIEVFQPIKIRQDNELIEKMKNSNPDFIVVVAFGQILSKEILDIPKFGCINLHASLLPDYRGAAPINWAVINGEKVTGNTTMFMAEGLDTGDMLLKDEVIIDEEMNFGDLYDILKTKGADLLVKTLDGLYKNNIVPVAQNKDDVFYAKMINKDLCYIDWDKSAKDIKNLVRGLNPAPAARTRYKDDTIKIFKIEILEKQSKGKSGEIIKLDKDGIYVNSKDNIILIKEIQIPGKKRMETSEYLRGHSLD
ncbi:MAG: methionyl-tRNA formyltransferase, partial [Clostridiaceae bacterium]